MSKGYTAFISIISILWVIMMAIDVVMTIILFKPNFANFSRIPFPLFVIIPLPLLIAYLPGLFTAIWLGVVIIAVIIFLIFAIYRSALKFENSSLYRLGEFFALNYFLSVVYITLISLVGHPIVSPITPSTPFYYNLFELTSAGLYEELISRVAYIGIPLFIYYAWSASGRRSPSRPSKLPWYRIIWGGNYKFGKPEITVLIISSIIFGFAHVTSWDLSKVPQAALGGFLLGVLYLRFGLYADVLFHFSIDSPSLLLPTGYGNPLASGVTTSFIGAVILVSLAAGLVVLISYIYQARSIYRAKKNSPRASVQKFVPESSVICSRCGSEKVTFLYDDIYRCDSCGTVFRKNQ
jgi:hypothetical protein